MSRHLHFIQVVYECDISWDIKMIQIFVDSLMAENRMVGLTQRRDSEYLLFTLMSKSKHTLVVFSN